MLHKYNDFDCTHSTFDTKLFLYNGFVVELSPKELVQKKATLNANVLAEVSLISLSSIFFCS